MEENGYFKRVTEKINNMTDEEFIEFLLVHQTCEIKNKKEVINELLDVIHAYQSASNKFINKVDTGKVKSVETYRELKECNEIRMKVLRDILNKLEKERNKSLEELGYSFETGV